MTMNAAIQLHDPERTRARIELIKATVAKGATDDELDLFLHVCDRTGLDPLAKQIYLVKRWDSKLKREIATTQVGIDGFRAIAARTGLYRGQTRTEWCGRDGVWRDCWLENTPPAAARVGVRCEGWPEPLVRVARYASYAQRNQDGQPIRQWANMPDVMLAKCAEALALRSAFPAQLSGLYTPEEMGQADNPALVVVAEHEPAREQKPASLPQHREVDGPSGAALQLLTGKLRALQTADELAGWIGELEKLHLSDSRLKRSIWEMFKVHAKALGHDSRDLAVLAARRKAQPAPAPAPEATPDVDHTVPMPSEPRIEYDAETGEVSP